MSRVIIAGGGISGVLCARELRLAGFEVTLLEARHIGAGSSSRTAAGIRQQFSTPGTVRGMRYAVRFYKDFAAETEDGRPPIVQSGYLFLYDTEASWSDAQARVVMQRAAGLAEVEALPADELVKRFPWVDPAKVRGGTFCPTDGFLLPAVVYNEGARRARELGAAIVQQAPIVGAVHANGRLVAVDTPKGRFEGDLFLDCTNAWSRRTARVLGAEELPVDPLKRYLWFLPREGGMSAVTLSSMPLVVSPSGVYCRPENADTLLVGRAHDAAPEPEFTYEDQDLVEPAFAHNTGFDSVAYAAWAALAEVLPPIGSFGGITSTTCGYYGSSPDHNPFLGFDRQVPNLVRLVGFSGHGAMFGPFTALVARALCEAGHDLASVSVDGAEVPIDAFRVGRAFGRKEQMVL